MKLKYASGRSSQRNKAAILIGVFLLFPFIVTLVMNLSDVRSSIAQGTWIITAVLLAGLLVCGFIYARPSSYLLLDPDRRVAVLVDGDDRREIAFAQLGPIRIEVRRPPGDRSARHYHVVSSAVPVDFYVDSLRDPAIARARKLAEFLGVRAVLPAGLMDGSAGDV